MAHLLPLLRILLLLTGLLPMLAGAASTLALNDDHRVFAAGTWLDYFEDQGRDCDIGCARAHFDAGAFEHSRVKAPNLGLTGSYWFRLTVRNDSPENDWVAEAGAPYLDEILLYAETAGGPLATLRSGDWMPTGERPLPARNIVFPLQLPAHEDVTIFLRLTNEGPVTLPLTFETRARFESDNATDNLIYGIYFGILFGVAVYNLMIYFIVRDRRNLYYVLYIAAFGLTMSTTYGFSAVYLWPDLPWWINRAIPVSTVISGFLVILFARTFLSLPRENFHDRIMSGMLVLLAALLPLGVFAPFGMAVRVIYIVAIGCAGWLLYIGIEQVLAGNKTARYFMLAWVALLVAVMMFLSTKLGLLPSTVLTEHCILIGSALEAILLSLALAHRLAVLRDESVTAQTLATQELERRVVERTHELDLALQARSEFLATVSHEIRTPMNGVLGIAELLLDTDLSARQREYANIIQSSGRTLLTIINDVLDYSKIEAGKMSLEHVSFRIRDVLNGSIQIFRAEAERKKLRFVTLIDDDVPAEITGDPVRLQQVLNNLLSNAIKFTDDGEIRLAVHREEDGKLTFSVQDTGIGIAADIQPKLFEAFNQGDQSMTRRFGGTGLGLAISRQLINLMGGSISFESDLGQGTTFYFTIPVDISGSGSWARIHLDEHDVSGPLKVLVVDDNVVNLQVAAGLLRKLGHHVETVADGQAAINRLFAADAYYDAVFMDCEMPGLDGFAATRLIRERERTEHRPHLPIIALTAHAFAEKVEACHAAGMDDHLAKPLNMRLLEQTLARWRRTRNA